MAPVAALIATILLTIGSCWGLLGAPALDDGDYGADGAPAATASPRRVVFVFVSPTPPADTSTSPPAHPPSDPPDAPSPSRPSDVVALPEPGRPYSAGDVHAMLKGYPWTLETAAGIADLLYTSDGRPYPSVDVETFCDRGTCIVRVSGSRDDDAEQFQGTDTQEFQVDLRTDAVRDVTEWTARSALPDRLHRAIDARVQRHGRPDIPSGPSALEHVLWMPPPDAGEFIAMYYVGCETTEVRYDAHADRILDVTSRPGFEGDAC